jgi:hypothetical protein
LVVTMSSGYLHISKEAIAVLNIMLAPAAGMSAPFRVPAEHPGAPERHWLAGRRSSEPARG